MRQLGSHHWDILSDCIVWIFWSCEPYIEDKINFVLRDVHFSTGHTYNIYSTRILYLWYVEKCSSHKTKLVLSSNIFLTRLLFFSCNKTLKRFVILTKENFDCSSESSCLTTKEEQFNASHLNKSEPLRHFNERISNKNWLWFEQLLE